MRARDFKKEEAICEASIDLINRKGLADTSMSQIAKQANVSPATIYIYFKNKEDLLKQLYLRIQREASQSIFTGYESFLPLDESFKILLRKAYQHFLRKPEHFVFLEQYSNSPLIEKIDKTEINDYFEPLYNLFDRGKQNKIIKDLPNEMLLSFTFYPIMQLVKYHQSGRLRLEYNQLEATLTMAWNSIKKDREIDSFISFR
ncbi:MAG: TetR/AcrR family transcriptional regulator [Saprospiraceae bacterium]|nr:TetR/AcrR family transcriptional regulator [Saprospiraceae bacterium]